MNISTDPWIPIVRQNGLCEMVSLGDAFAQGDEIRDLAVRPHERIAVMRLLICVAQAALDGPGDQDEWRACRSRIAPAALDYLSRWKNAFELFGLGQRFLQVSDLKRAGGKAEGEDDEGGLVSKLDVALASGHNVTLFDNAGGAVRQCSPAKLALDLLSFQCFSPGGRIGMAMWAGSETSGKGSSTHAPCIADGMLHALLRGQTMSETVHLNLLTKEDVERLYGLGHWGEPLWEHMPTGPVEDFSCTYLGRLVPLSRAISIAVDGSSLILANGIKYESYPQWREPTATVVTHKRNGQPCRVLLSASLERAPWRELYALMAKAISHDSIGGPLALQQLPDGSFDLWVGGLVANKAKLLDSIESVFHVPASMQSASGQLAYEQEVHAAEEIEFRIRRAVSVYHKELSDDLDRPESRNRRREIQRKAVGQYWMDVEQAVPKLLEMVELIGDSPHEETARIGWKRAVTKAARESYGNACPHETARQIRAFALGLKALEFSPQEKQQDEREEETEE